MFRFARCEMRTVVCKPCDRGYIYCGKECSSQARRENLRAANRRYQRSFRGRMANAERQSRYRARRAEAAPAPESKKVTDHRSPVGNGLRIRAGDGRFVSAVAAETLKCRFCGRPCARRLLHGDRRLRWRGSGAA